MCLRRMSIYRFGFGGRLAQVRCGIIGGSSLGAVASRRDLGDAKQLCRITIHNASWDYEGSQPRHGTRVTALAEAPHFQADAPSRREALGLAVDE